MQTEYTDRELELAIQIGALRHAAYMALSIFLNPNNTKPADITKACDMLLTALDESIN